MPVEGELPIPVEIPWKLAATTQQLQEGFPDETTISLFTYEPTIESLERDYPEERLIYLKFTVSVSPCQIAPETRQESGRNLLVGGLPVLHLILDVGVTPEPFVTGGIRPYFHAAAPIRRSMIQTGIVGDAVFEGESESLSIGKSASQLRETISSQVTTKSKGWSLGLPGIVGGGKQSSTTTVDSDRSVEQYLETINREASEERRELLSHMTHVENMLTLLNAKHVGSPFLRFTLSPRPLHQLTIDPIDPNLWYNQLLQRRSSGIEGIQEFFAIVAVPRGMNFCIQALLRRICVLDEPPVPPDYPSPYALSDLPTPAEFSAMIDYLTKLYPAGTPLDQLDIDIFGQFEGLESFPKKSQNFIPSLWIWTGMGDDDAGYNIIGGMAAFPYISDAGFISIGFLPFAYKPFTEVRLDMLRYAYLQDLARSPLERGIVVSHSTELRSCFAAASTGGIRVSNSEASVSPVQEIPFNPKHIFLPTQAANQGRIAISLDPTATVTRWNDMEGQLVNRVAELSKQYQTPLSMNSPKMIQVFLRYWSKLDSRDPQNLPLHRVASVFKLTPEQLRLLETAKVKDLKGLAQMILAAPNIEQQKADLQEFLAKFNEKQRCKLNLDQLKPIEFSIPSHEIECIRELIGKALQKDDLVNDGESHFEDESTYNSEQAEA